jgi:hypothetical protein
MKAICVQNVSLGVFYQDHKKGKIKIPRHQEPRSVCGGMWEERKKRSWIKKINELADTPYTSTEKHLGTSIQTYKIKGADPTSPKFINDGTHRAIHSINWYVQLISPNEDLKKKNKKSYDEKMKKLQKFYEDINQIVITECFMEFENLEEAIEEYQRINTQGSTSTTYQVLSSKFPVLINEYGDDWAALINRIDLSIAPKLIFLGFNSNKVGAILPEDNEKTRHDKEKHMRDTRASFLRYATKDTRQQPYFGVTNKFLRETTKKCQDNHKKLESDLSCFFNDRGYSESLEIVSKWEEFLDEATAFYKQIYEETFGNNKINTETAVRWWLSYYVYSKNLKTNIEKIREFTEIFLKKFEGKTSFPYFNKQTQKQSNITAQLQKMCSTYYEVFGLDPKDMEPNRPKRKKQKSNQKLAPGYHDSHIKSFAIHGEGETLVENKVENIQRGAKEMTKEELERLQTVQ